MPSESNEDLLYEAGGSRLHGALRLSPAPMVRPAGAAWLLQLGEFLTS